MFKKIKKENILNSLLRHNNVNKEYYNKVKEIPRTILENLGTDLAKEAVSLSREVDSELHSHKAFLRFSISPHGILYSRVEKMKHKNEINLLRFFTKRFPTFLILVESHRGVFALKRGDSLKVYTKPLDSVLKEYEEKLPFLPSINSLCKQDYQNLWKSFAESQFIEENKISNQIIQLSKIWKQSFTIDHPKKRKLEDYFS